MREVVVSIHSTWNLSKRALLVIRILFDYAWSRYTMSSTVPLYRMRSTVRPRVQRRLLGVESADQDTHDRTRDGQTERIGKNGNWGKYLGTLHYVYEHLQLIALTKSGLLRRSDLSVGRYSFRTTWIVRYPGQRPILIR